MDNVNGYIKIMEYFNTHTIKEVIESVYGRTFDIDDSYYREKAQKFIDNKLRWLGQLDSMCVYRLNALSHGIDLVEEENDDVNTDAIYDEHMKYR